MTIYAISMLHGIEGLSENRPEEKKEDKHWAHSLLDEISLVVSPRTIRNVRLGPHFHGDTLFRHPAVLQITRPVDILLPVRARVVVVVNEVGSSTLDHA